MQPKTKKKQNQMEMFERELPGNPYDGHTLGKQLDQVRRVAPVRVAEVHVDMGYRGHGYEGEETIHVDKRRRANTAKTLWKKMKRRAAVEPTIGHCKSEHRMERNRLSGEMGDAINAILSAASMNFQKLLGAFLRLILGVVLGVYALIQAVHAVLRVLYASAWPPCHAPSRVPAA